MYSPTFARFRSTLVVLTVALSLVLVPQVARPAVVAAAPAQQPGVVGICGPVSGFQAATASAAGTITIGITAYAIAKNVSLTLSGVTLQNGTLNGQNLCFQLTLSTGVITAATVTPNTTTTATVCGTVTAYVPGQSITVNVNGTTEVFTIAAGATASGPGLALLATVNPSLCFQFTLNGLRQVTTAMVTANTSPVTTGSVQLCGLVTAYTPAGAANTTATGALAISGLTLTLAAGMTPAGTAITVPAYYCLTFTSSGGKVTALSAVLTMVPVNYVCGAFTTFAAATTTAAATYTVGGMVFPVSSAMFTTVTGSLVANQVYCFRLLNGAIIGLLSTVPTAATPAVTSGERYRVGGHWVD